MIGFGEYIKNLRTQHRITLREFCRRINYDPSNWSKIERGVLLPPKSKLILESIIETLGVEKNSDEYHTVLELAASSYIPEDLISTPNISEKLPVFFRTLRGQKPTEEELTKLIELLKTE